MCPEHLPCAQASQFMALCFRLRTRTCSTSWVRGLFLCPGVPPGSCPVAPALFLGRSRGSWDVSGSVPSVPGCSWVRVSRSREGLWRYPAARGRSGSADGPGSVRRGERGRGEPGERGQGRTWGEGTGKRGEERGEREERRTWGEGTEKRGQGTDDRRKPGERGKGRTCVQYLGQHLGRKSGEREPGHRTQGQPLDTEPEPYPCRSVTPKH